MNIQTVVEYLNKRRGFNLSSSYYTAHIAEWVNWWKGYHKPFHHFRELADQKVIERDMYTLKMAKKVCEDWAAILLNEKTEIIIDDKASAEFVQGKDGTGVVFSDNDFWVKANDLVERAFMSGSGAFVLRLNGMTLSGDAVVKDKDTKIRIDYVTATNMIPISVKNGIITDRPDIYLRRGHMAEPADDHLVQRRHEAGPADLHPDRADIHGDQVGDGI